MIKPKTYFLLILLAGLGLLSAGLAKIVSFLDPFKKEGILISKKEKL